MNNYFERVLMNAIFMCEGEYVREYNDRRGFAHIYPFTTENISGYISEFELENRSLLTVGSSSDQLINASIFNCKSYSVIDICPYTKFYFYLKKAALLTLDYHSFLSFFCYKNFLEPFKDNEQAFNLESFLRIKPCLRLIDYESYLFWDELFSLFSPLIIRQELFKADEDKIKILKQTNIYLKNEASYELAKNSIKHVNPTFIIGDIFYEQLTQSYDNIFLSNLAQYHSRQFTKILVDDLLNNLNDGGQMLVCYLYRTIRDTKYKNDWASIYNLDKTFDLFKQYNLELKSFIGNDGILFDDSAVKDSILIYKKNKLLSKLNYLKRDDCISFIL